jgi:hypothetical protein
VSTRPATPQWFIKLTPAQAGALSMMVGLGIFNGEFADRRDCIVEQSSTKEDLAKALDRLQKKQSENSSLTICTRFYAALTTLAFLT